MRNTIKIILFSAIVLFAIFGFSNRSNAATIVNNENSLRSAVESADSGATITLSDNITVTQPIVIAKELTINGNGHTVTGDSSWTSTSGNQTMFTAQLGSAKLRLQNINLKNGPKYGVQAYDGGAVILEGVYITGFNYGAVLVNGGNLEIKNLKLGYNGTGANNGIEIDKGASATNNPTVTMNGTLNSESKENVLRVADNGYLTEFTITNTENTATFSRNTGYLPVRTSALESDSYQQFLANENDPFEGYVAKAINAAFSQKDFFYTDPAFTGSSIVRDYTNTLVQDIFIYDKSFDSAIKSFYANLEQLDIKTATK